MKTMEKEGRKKKEKLTVSLRDRSKRNPKGTELVSDGIPYK